MALVENMPTSDVVDITQFPQVFIMPLLTEQIGDTIRIERDGVTKFILVFNIND